MLIDFLWALWSLGNAMAPYILGGLLLAGILHELVPGDFIQKHLGKNNFFSVVKATLLGIPLPVCSCGVVPLAAAIKKEGASRGATLSFLIATPITGLDSILATFGMFGWTFTLYRLVSSVVLALFSGWLANLANVPAAPAPAMSFATNPASLKTAMTPLTPAGTAAPKRRAGFSFRAALAYGFGRLLGDIAKALLFGLLIGAAIAVAIPDNLAELLRANLWAGYLLALAIALPMYVCATASLPIAASLVASGVSLGAAFVFLSAGPATNTVTMGVVKKMLGTRSLTLYLGVISGGSILFGLILDLFFGHMALEVATVLQAHATTNLFSALSAVILIGLCLYHLLTPWLSKKEEPCDDKACRA